ncbi:MAG: polysaccharide pyruvyl transferase family protein [Acidobacteriota bacterium]
MTCHVNTVINQLEAGRRDIVLWEALAGSVEEGDAQVAAIAAAAESELWRDARRLALAWSAGGAHLDSGPLVSIVIPTFNRPELLRRALESVASQLYRPIEAVVVNDAGCAVNQVIAEFRDRLPIQLIEHERNKYLAAARNSGAKAARGEYIGYLDDDDRLYPHHVGHLVHLLVSTNARAARAVALIRRPAEQGVGPDFFKPLPWRAFELSELLEENVTPVQAVLHERALIDAIGGFDAMLRANEDWDFWIRLRAAVQVTDSRVVTSGVDATNPRRMSAESNKDFLHAHRVIYRRYHELTDQHGGAALATKQNEQLTWIEQRPQREAAPNATPEPSTVVLNYHRVHPSVGEDPYQLAITPALFESHLRHLCQQYRVVSAEEFLHGAPTSDPRPRVLLTFDDAYRDFYLHAWPILRKHRVPAVLFVPTGHVGPKTPFWWEVLVAAGRSGLQEPYKKLPPEQRNAALDALLEEFLAQTRRRLSDLSCNWAMLREIAADGLVEMGAHTQFHSSLGALDRLHAQQEIEGSLNDLERELGRRPRLFAFPHGGPGDISETAIELLVSYGVTAAFTTSSGAIEPQRRSELGQRSAMRLPRLIVQPFDALELERRIQQVLAPAEAPRTGRRIVVLSGISAQNLGDDAMLIATVCDLRRRDPSAAITVLAENPEACGSVAAQIDVPIERSLQRFVARELAQVFPDEVPAKRVLLAARQFVLDREQIISGQFPAWLPEPYRQGVIALLTADGVIDCGGANLSSHWQSYFYEKCLDYLISAKPLFVTGQGIDRCIAAPDEVLLRTALSRVTEITVREAHSEAYLRELGVSAALSTVGDDAISLEPAPRARVQSILQEAGVAADQPYIAFQYRHYLDHADDHAPAYFASCIDAAIAGTGLPVIGVPMHFAGTDEREHLELLSSRVAYRGEFVVLRNELTPAEAKALMAGAQLAFGISYHSAVFALSSGVPYLGLYRGAHYQQKMLGLAALFDMRGLPVPIDTTTPLEFERCLLQMMESREALSARLLHRATQIAAEVGASRARFLDAVPHRSPAKSTAPGAALQTPKVHLAKPAQPLTLAPIPAPLSAPSTRSPIDWGQLRSMHPVSSKWGFDRGTPIDRVYIEQFLEQHSGEIRGEVAEIGGDEYARRFGGNRVSRVEVIDVSTTNPRATRIADLNKPGSLPRRAYDTFILTQTLPHIHDVVTAVAEVYQSLKPGGTLLLTVPSIIKVSREPEDHWRFTVDSITRLVNDLCPGARADVRARGNLVAAIGFLIGAAAEDLKPDEMNCQDEAYPVSITACVRREVTP